MTEDWDFFHANPARTYRLRLATAAEIITAALRGLVREPPPDHLVYCIVRVLRDEGRMEYIPVTLEAQWVIDETAARREWEAALAYQAACRKGLARNSRQAPR